MEFISDILGDSFITETKKLEMINMLCDKQLANMENMNIENILNISTENIKLKCDVLRKIFMVASNFEENLNYFIEYFTKTFFDFKNHELLATILIFLFERFDESDRIQNVIKQLDVEKINEVILNTVFLHKNCHDEMNKIFNVYLMHLSIENQTLFLNNLLSFSKSHKSIEFLGLTLENLTKAAITHETSVLRTEDFWTYLLNCLENCNDIFETQKVIFVLSTCTNLLKNENINLQFLSVDHNEKTWNAFLALVQVFNYGNKQLLKPALELLKHIQQLHFFWQYWIFKLLVKRATRDLKCEILLFFLKQPIPDRELQDVFKIIFTAINEQKCSNMECPVAQELNHLCQNLNYKQFPIILDEIFKVSWNIKQMNIVIKNVLVDSKKKLIDFDYFYRFEAFINKIVADRDSSYYWEIDSVRAIIEFFWDPESFDNILKIKRSPISRDWIDCSENLKDVAVEKIMKLSEKNSDDITELEIYFSFLQDNNTFIHMIKTYPLSIHVRIVIYERLFNMGGYYLAQTELDEEKTVTDFYEYLTKHLNEKSYIAFRELMIYFLDLMGRYMSFAYPKKACLEVLNIMQNPKLYTKYQIYCATRILRLVDFRFHELWRNYTSEKEYYKEIAEKWKFLILETEDEKICKEGLYYVLKKGIDQLTTKEYNEIVKKLLEKHLCDDVAKAIYRGYLNPDLMNFAFKQLNDIMKCNLRKYEYFSKLFCEAVVSGEYLNSNQFSCENEEFKFCSSNSKHLEYFIREVDFRLLDYSGYIECREKIIDLTIKTYLNELSNPETKLYCLHILMRIVSRHSYYVAPPSPLEYFKEEVKWIMNRFKDEYAVNLKNDVNKLRIVQALFLLIPYVMRDFDGKFKHIEKLWKINIHKKLRKSLKRIAVGILVRESDSKNNAVRQICQYMYILLSTRDATFEDIKCIIEKIKEQPNLVCSFMPVLYHVMPFCNFLQNETEEIVASLFLLLPTSDEKLRVYTEILLQRIYILYNNGKFKNIIEKYLSELERINLDIESNTNQIADILKTDYVFLKVLDPIRDHSMETVLNILPKLNQVVSGEWKDIMKYNLIWYSNIDEFTIKKDTNESLKKSVEEFLKIQEFANNEYVNYCGEDILELFRVSYENFNLTRKKVTFI